MIKAAARQTQQWAACLPFDLVEATEHHGPYITTAFGTTVCDFYTMSMPGFPSTASGGPSKPILFTDAVDNAAFLWRAANAHDQMLGALTALDAWWTVDFPSGPEGDREWAGGIGRLSDDTIDIWRAVRAAIAAAGGNEVPA